ncbi:MAG: tetratricopeptide repeat protein [Deltaproteobacteria bacterium]|nr:tetratricopeptide repeat protein [Deltaproteobacteria bacterium]
MKRTDDKQISFSSAYNLGDSLFKQGDFQGAAQAFKQAIKINPGDEDSKYNYGLALKTIEENQKKEKEKQQENQEQDQDQEQAQDKKKDEPNKKQEQNQNKENQRTSEEYQSGAMSKNEAEAFLDNIGEDPAAINRLRFHGKEQKTASGKDW